jgi:hypothetical protein
VPERSRDTSWRGLSPAVAWFGAICSSLTKVVEPRRDLADAVDTGNSWTVPASNRRRKPGRAVASPTSEPFQGPCCPTRVVHMSCTCRVLLGFCALVGLTHCGEDARDPWPYPPDCYFACVACCDDRFEDPAACREACSVSPFNPADFPECADLSECPTEGVSLGSQWFDL